MLEQYCMNMYVYIHIYIYVYIYTYIYIYVVINSNPSASRPSTPTVRASTGHPEVALAEAAIKGPAAPEPEVLPAAVALNELVKASDSIEDFCILADENQEIWEMALLFFGIV